ncbi:MAG: hypothetical protein IH872_05870 [Chloroflexi bacterium]|nr:hypothetical protein [Chloroflexota bacterium]
MPNKRLGGLGLIIGAAAMLAVACGGGDDRSSVTASQPATTPVATAAPSAATAPPAATSDTTSPPTTAAARYTWEVSVVDRAGAKPSIAVDASGIPHIAFMSEATPGFVKSAVLNGGAWDISTVTTGYLYGPLDIALDANGSPHIVWHNHDNEDGAHGRLENGEWVNTEIKNSGHDGWDINVAIDSTGSPHVLGVDPVQFGSQNGLEYATFDGQSWTVESVGTGALPYEFGNSIALDSQDRPHIVWFDAQAQDLKYALKDSMEDGGGWAISTVDSAGDVGRYPSLALDQNGNPVVSYYETLGESNGAIKLARWDGSRWNTQRVDQLDDVFPGFFGARKNSEVVLDPDGSPIVAYSDESVVKLAAWNGDGWDIQTVATGGDEDLGQQVSLALDSQGVLHLTFADVRQKSRPGVLGTVMYARGTP